MKFNNTTFRKGYKPTFADFKKSHEKVIGIENLVDAYKKLTGDRPSKQQLKVLKEQIDGNSKSTTE